MEQSSLRPPLRPLVGVTACFKDNGRGGWHHTVGDKYVRAAIQAVGALPILIPAIGPEFGEDATAMTEALDRLLDSLDGILLTGSPSNVEPHHYGGRQSRQGTAHDPARDATTLPLIRHSLDRGVPLFAICRGYQELNVVLGGSLHQHVEEQPGYHDHRENPDDPLDVQYGPSHEVHLVEGGMLYRLAGTDTVTVNSLHSQGVARLADGVTVEAVADDGLVEGFIVDSAPGYTLAVQWHPEWQVTENDFSMAIFQSFGDACRDHARDTRGAA